MSQSEARQRRRQTGRRIVVRVDPYPTFVDLPPRQRRHFVLLGVGGLVVCSAFFAMSLLGRSPRIPMAIAWILLGTVAFVVNLRIAVGWIEFERDGLRTSRMFRGRYLRWDEVVRFEAYDRTTRIARLRVVRAHLRDGRRVILPVPRATDPAAYDAYELGLRRLRARIRR